MSSAMLVSAPRRAAAPRHQIAQQRDVVFDLEPRHQVRLLEHQPDAAGVAQVARRRAADRDAAARRRHQVGDDLEQRALAASRGADQRHEGAVGDLQVDPGQRLDRLGAADPVGHVDIRDRDRGAAARGERQLGSSARHVSASLSSPMSASAFASSRLSTIALVYISFGVGFLVRSPKSRQDVDRGLPLGVVHQAEALREVGRIVRGRR